MQLRPTNPMPKAADVQRRERSWIFMAGQRQFSFTRIEQSASFATGHRIEVSRPRGWSPTAILGTMLAILGGVTLFGLAINSSRAAAGYRYVVSVPIPPSRMTKAPLRQVAANVAVRTAKKLDLVPARSPSSAAISADVPEAQDYVVGDLDSPEATAAATTMTAAVRAAMSSGHLQQWSAADGHERGFVVVGPADAASGCRALSILTRRDGENHVQSRRECAARD